MPRYRLFLTDDELAMQPVPELFIRMMGASLYQRSNLTVNHGKFYIDTTVSEAEQKKKPGVTHVNVFTAGQTYHLFPLFAEADTRQAYQMYLGKNAPETYLYDEFDEGKICANTSVAIDCPAGGCYGFSVMLPDDFSTEITRDPRPAPDAFSSDEALSDLHVTGAE